MWVPKLDDDKNEGDVNPSGYKSTLIASSGTPIQMDVDGTYHSWKMKKEYLMSMLGSIPHQEFSFYHLPTRGRVGIKLGDVDMYPMYL